MKKKERKLTKKELKRKEDFEKLCEKMEQEGFETNYLTVGIVQANILALVIMMPFVLFFVWLYYKVNLKVSAELGSGILFLLAIICLIVAHEVIHGITWGIFAKNHAKSIDFGVIWSMLTPYCTCTEALKKWQYILGSAMPTIILGFGLGTVSIILNSYPLFVLAILLIFSGGGDFLIILKTLLHRTKGKEAVYYDHPYECGLVVFERNK